MNPPCRTLEEYTPEKPIIYMDVDRFISNGCPLFMPCVCAARDPLNMLLPISDFHKIVDMEIFYELEKSNARR